MKKTFLFIPTLLLLSCGEDSTLNTSESPSPPPVIAETQAPPPAPKLSCDKSNYKDYIFNKEKTAQLIAETGKGCQLQGMSFRGEQGLGGAYFQHADLTSADFINSKVPSGNFSNAILYKARFDNAKLDGCIFISADIRGAVFSGASMYAISAYQAKYNNKTKFNHQLDDHIPKMIFEE